MQHTFWNKKHLGLSYGPPNDIGLTPLKWAEVDRQGVLCMGMYVWVGIAHACSGSGLRGSEPLLSMALHHNLLQFNPGAGTTLPVLMAFPTGTLLPQWLSLFHWLSLSTLPMPTAPPPNHSPSPSCSQSSDFLSQSLPTSITPPNT
jgi:hypothetical protein